MRAVSIGMSSGQPRARNVFADGFTGKDLVKSPADAVARPDGVAQGPDGSLYVTDSQKGKVWRILYMGR